MENASFAEGYAIGRDTNNGGGYGWGGCGEWIWIIVLFALWQNGGFGFGNRGGSELAGYEIGKLATTNDVASGFSTSTIMSTQRDMQLANVQGFSGVNSAISNGVNTISNAICNLGYNMQNNINGLSREIADCCCSTKNMILENRYLNEKQTCDIITNANANTQRIMDYFTSEKIASLQADKAALTAQLSQNAQTKTLIDTLRPVAQPAYITCSPYESIYGNRCGCGNGCF